MLRKMLALAALAVLLGWGAARTVGAPPSADQVPARPDARVPPLPSPGWPDHDWCPTWPKPRPPWPTPTKPGPRPDPIPDLPIPRYWDPPVVPLPDYPPTPWVPKPWKPSAMLLPVPLGGR